MTIPEIKEQWKQAINTVTFGATEKEGGTRLKTYKLGGANGLPFLSFESDTPYAPVLALEIWDVPPPDMPEVVAKHYQDVVASPQAWAERCAELGADAICLRLMSAHPDFGGRSAEECASTVKEVLKVGLPLIIWGCDDEEIDNLIFPPCSEAAAGEKCLLGTAKENNYKTITACCLADGHNLITESPIDINIAKQINILVMDMGLPADRIVMYQTTGALGYGLEYAYSIQERGRLAALAGDKTMAMPVLCLLANDAWRVKEASGEEPEWGDSEKRGILWESISATVLLQSGADIFVMWHPTALNELKKTVNNLLAK